MKKSSMMIEELFFPATYFALFRFCMAYLSYEQLWCIKVYRWHCCELSLLGLSLIKEKSPVILDRLTVVKDCDIVHFLF